MSALAMTSAEREAFLAQPHEAILALARRGGAPPAASPVWRTSGFSKLPRPDAGASSP